MDDNVIVVVLVVVVQSLLEGQTCAHGTGVMPSNYYFRYQGFTQQTENNNVRGLSGG